MKYSTAFTVETHEILFRHLAQRPGQEDLCFALWYPSNGRERHTALINKALLPIKGDRNLHGNTSFNSQYVERTITFALENKAGIAFLHSHLGPGWQNLSSVDILAESSIAPAVMSATGLPLVGLTLGTDGSWSSRFWNKIGQNHYEHSWCESVRVVGDAFRITFANHLLPTPLLKDELEQTVSAWGDKTQANLARITMGIVGLGSVGSIIAEALGRMGIHNIKLIDFDRVEIHNLDRHLSATKYDIGKFKTDIVSKRLNLISTAGQFKVKAANYSIVENQGFREALDCDLIFSCVDRPWARQVLNFIAYAHLIPVVDGGVTVQKSRIDTLLSADWKAHIAAPSRRCLECLEQYQPGFVSLEQDGSLDDPTYIKSLGEDHHLFQNQNVFAFSLSVASFQLLQMLSMVVAPFGISNVGEFNYHFVNGRLDVSENKSCKTNCLFSSVDMLAKGDSAPIEITGNHPIAKETREKSSSFSIKDLLMHILRFVR